MVTYSPELANKICAAVRPSALRARPREPRLGEGPYNLTERVASPVASCRRHAARRISKDIGRPPGPYV